MALGRRVMPAVQQRALHAPCPSFQPSSPQALKPSSPPDRQSEEWLNAPLDTTLDKIKTIFARPVDSSSGNRRLHIFMLEHAIPRDMTPDCIRTVPFGFPRLSGKRTERRKGSGKPTPNTVGLVCNGPPALPREADSGEGGGVRAIGQQGRRVTG
jgi:hypothetical protein